MVHAFYLGSFNPFHNGHLEIANYLIKNYDTVHILLNAPSKCKPNRAPLQHRKNIIKCYLEETERLCIITDPVDEYMKKYEDDDTIGIMGSDAYNDIIHKKLLPKLKVKRWLVVTRNDDVCLNNTLEHFNVTFLCPELFKEQMYSSTLVREQLLNKCVSTTMVCEDMISYCHLVGLYTNDTTLCNFVENNYLTVSYVENKIIGVKLFFNEKKRYLDSLEGYDNLKLLINISYPVASYCGDKLCYLLFTQAEGISLTKLIQLRELNYFNCVDFYNIGKQLGKMVKALHSFKNQDFTEEDKQINPIIKKIGEEHFDEIVLKYKKCYLHGDLSINNVCVNPETKEIYLIDPEKALKYIDKKHNNAPMGISYYEYNQFISSIGTHYGNCSSGEILAEGFIDGYKDIEIFEPLISYWIKK